MSSEHFFRMSNKGLTSSIKKQEKEHPRLEPVQGNNNKALQILQDKYESQPGHYVAAWKWKETQDSHPINGHVTFLNKRPLNITLQEAKKCNVPLYLMN